MNQATVRPLIAADILKLRRHRGTMTTAALLSVGMAIVYFAFIEARHHGNLAGPQVLSDGATMTGTYFGAFAAILIGAEAGTTDLASGVFRDLVATGRSRTTLFLVRIPAAVTIAVTLTLSGYAVAVAAAYAGHGSAQAPTTRAPPGSSADRPRRARYRPARSATPKLDTRTRPATAAPHGFAESA